MALSRTRLAPAALGFAPLLAAPVVVADEQSSGLSVAEAACTVFAGTRQCDTVSIDDAENCVLKVVAGSPPKVEPEYATCLFDEVGTAKVHLRRLTPAPPCGSRGTATPSR